jgi:GNAT superfamily N-acetyltransferase
MAEVTVWYLELREGSRQATNPLPPDTRVAEAVVKQFEFNRFLYRLVGGPWQWTDKLSWSDQQWQAYAERDALRTWVAWVEGSPAGYFELEKHKNKSVELCYFGLAPAFIGRHFGGSFLSRALDEVWRWGASRISVNTCSLDHPRALDTYRKLGFSLVNTELRSS